MKKLSLILMAAALGVLLTLPAFALGPGEGRGPGGCQGNNLSYGRDYGYHHEGYLAKLNLTDEQKSKIEALRDANYKATRPLREKMFDKSVELRRLWLQANPDKDKISATQKEIRTLRDSLEDKHTALRLEIRKVLTPEQNEKLANSRWDRGPGFGPRGGMRGQGEFGPGHGPGPGMGMCQ
jgi:Spy/CpxP family protein refolding chaperone